MNKNRENAFSDRTLLFLGLGLLVAALVVLSVALYIPWAKQREGLKKIRAHAQVLDRHLQFYVKRTGQFPSKFEDLLGTADGELLAALSDGCFQVYTKPSPKDPPKTAVIVIRCGDQQAIIQKDFHLLVWQ